MNNYRGKYLIAVYSLLSEGETLLALCENVREFAKYLKVSEKSARVTLTHLFNKNTKFIRLNGKIRTVEFIEYENE